MKKLKDLIAFQPWLISAATLFVIGLVLLYSQKTPSSTQEPSLCDVYYQAATNQMSNQTPQISIAYSLIYQNCLIKEKQ